MIISKDREKVSDNLTNAFEKNMQQTRNKSVIPQPDKGHL